MIGSAEKAGSGVNKIMSGWDFAHWRRPFLIVTSQPDRLTLELPMSSIIPEETIHQLREIFGDDIDVLGKEELVEQRGFGFQSIKELPTKYNLPLPIVTYDSPYIVMTFPRSGEALKTVSSENNIHELSADELKVYNWIRTQNEVSTKDYAEAFGIAQRTASRHLSKLLELKLIETNGENLKSPKLKYKSKE